MTGTVPTDLCAEHARIWLAWKRYPDGYRHDRPRDAGSLGPISDARTSHAERRAGWVKLAEQQMAGTEAACRSGRSAQCTAVAA